MRGGPRAAPHRAGERAARGRRRLQCSATISVATATTALALPRRLRPSSQPATPKPCGRRAQNGLCVSQRPTQACMGEALVRRRRQGQREVGQLAVPRVAWRQRVLGLLASAAGGERRRRRRRSVACVRCAGAPGAATAPQRFGRRAASAGRTGLGNMRLAASQVSTDERTAARTHRRTHPLRRSALRTRAHASLPRPAAPAAPRPRRRRW